MIHHVFANRSNVGDWLSARGIRSLLGEEPATEHLCDEPFIGETLDRLSSVGDDDLVLVGGGGLFMDYFEPFWRGFTDLADRFPYCIWGVGYVDLKQEPSRPPTALIEDLVRRSRLCVVRDELTRGLLASCHLQAAVPCPSLVAVERIALGHGVLHVDNYTTAGASTYDAMHAMATRFAEATGRPYLQTNNRITAGREDELASILDRYARSDLVVSSALHGCVIGLAMGRRVIAVSGDRKIESFMDAAGLSSWVLDVSEVDRLPDMLDAASGQPDRRGFVEDALAGNGEVARAVLAEAARSGRRART